jgi:hypothetical protein
MTTPQPRTNNISFQLIFPEIASVIKDSDGFYKVKPKNPMIIQTFIINTDGGRPPEYIEKVLSLHRYEIKNLTNFLKNIKKLSNDLAIFDKTIDANMKNDTLLMFYRFLFLTSFSENVKDPVDPNKKSYIYITGKIIEQEYIDLSIECLINLKRLRTIDLYTDEKQVFGIVTDQIGSTMFLSGKDDFNIELDPIPTLIKINTPTPPPCPTSPPYPTSPPCPTLQIQVVRSIATKKGFASIFIIIVFITYMLMINKRK